MHAGASDDAYVAAGASVFGATDLYKELSGADVILSVQPLTTAQAAKVKRGAITISFLSSSNAADSIDALAQAGATAISLEAVPRISRAQSMDALTSQALCAGYKAALTCAWCLDGLAVDDAGRGDDFALFAHSVQHQCQIVDRSEEEASH